MSNSILDEQGDVVLYNAPYGTRWVFRDDVCHGLILGQMGLATTLTREGETEAAVLIANVGDRAWTATMLPVAGRALAHHDTRYGLIAKVARRLLMPAACCKGEAL